MCKSCSPISDSLCIGNYWVPHSHFCVVLSTCLRLEMCPLVWALGHQSALVPCLPALPSAPGHSLDGQSGVLSVSALSICWLRVRHSCSPLEPRRDHLEVIPPIEPDWGWAIARTLFSFSCWLHFSDPFERCPPPAFFFLIHLFIYLLAALGLHCCTRASSSCGERGLRFVAVRGLLIAVASLVAEHGL